MNETCQSRYLITRDDSRPSDLRVILLTFIATFIPSVNSTPVCALQYQGTSVNPSFTVRLLRTDKHALTAPTSLAALTALTAPTALTALTVLTAPIALTALTVLTSLTALTALALFQRYCYADIRPVSYAAWKRSSIQGQRYHVVSYNILSFLNYNAEHSGAAIFIPPTSESSTPPHPPIPGMYVHEKSLVKNILYLKKWSH